MKNYFLLLALAAFVPLHAESAPEQLATEVMQASGSANLPKVTRLQFTFRVMMDGQEKVAAKHDWNVAANTDTVSWGGKTVTVNLLQPGKSPDEKAAFQRWTNDSYWLLAPLKLKDPGTDLAQPTANELEVSFRGVGLTPGDHYIYEIDPQTHLPKTWTYIPKPDARKRATWEKYRTCGGLTLATYHKMGKVEIFIDGLDVTAKP